MSVFRDALTTSGLDVGRLLNSRSFSAGDRAAFAVTNGDLYIRGFKGGYGFGDDAAPLAAATADFRKGWEHGQEAKSEGMS